MEQSSTSAISSGGPVFTAVPTVWLRDARLSFKARGLLALMLTHHGGEMNRQEIIDSSPQGHGAVDSALAELERYGYLGHEARHWVWYVLPEAAS